MQLRLDQLLAALRDEAEAVLAAIDADPLLLKRSSGELILANASQLLFTPQAQHQLYAKGIVYRRDPLRLVSLPLIKIYNLGEREVTVADLTRIASEPQTGLRFLRKLDGSLIQVFRADGRVWFTTRGMLEGARLKAAEDNEERATDFDYLGVARRMAEERYPRLFEDPALLEGRTLLFELIHPEARVVTNYGDLADLVLLACFDHRRFAYLSYDEVCRIGAQGGLSVVVQLTPSGSNLEEQIEALRTSWAGTDEEGCVLCFERGEEVVYRVKVKSAEYLQLMRLMAFCTYDRTVEMIDSNPQASTWEGLEALLKELGREKVPEEVLGYYREHWDRFQRYLAGLDRLRSWAESARAQLEQEIGGRDNRPVAEFRKAFAARAVRGAIPKLLFAALDARLDVARMRKMFPTDRDVEESLALIDGTTPRGG